MIPNANTKAVRINSTSIPSATEIISLKCNQAKSSVLVTGGNNACVREARDELTSNSVTLNGQPVGVKESDTYLGMVIHSGGANASIHATLNAGMRRAWFKAANIKSIQKSKHLG